MKNNVTKKLTAVILILSLVLSCNVVAFATTSSEDSTAITRTVGGVSLAFNATSSTQACAKVIGSSNGETPYIISKVTLQEAPLGSSNFVNSNVSPSIMTVYDTLIFHTSYWPITSSKNYRIKVEMTDEVNGIRLTTVWFKNLAS